MTFSIAGMGEPVAWINRDNLAELQHGGPRQPVSGKSHLDVDVPLYTAPPIDVQAVREAVTEEDIAEAVNTLFVNRLLPNWQDTVRAALEKFASRHTRQVPDDYKEIARLIGSIFFCGNFKAETHSERELEKLLRKTGNFYDTEAQWLAAGPPEPSEEVE